MLGGVERAGELVEPADIREPAPQPGTGKPGPGLRSVGVPTTDWRAAMPAKKSGLTLDEHKALGSALCEMRDELIKLYVETANK